MTFTQTYQTTQHKVTERLTVHFVEVWKTWLWKSQNFTFLCCDHDKPKLSGPGWSVYGVLSVIKAIGYQGGESIAHIGKCHPIGYGISCLRHCPSQDSNA